MKAETKRIKEYKDKRVKEGKAYEFRVLLNDEELTNFAKNIPNKSEFLKKAIYEQIKKHA